MSSELSFVTGDSEMLLQTCQPSAVPWAVWARPFSLERPAGPVRVCAQLLCPSLQRWGNGSCWLNVAVLGFSS